jgi:hypothetical protein
VEEVLTIQHPMDSSGVMDPYLVKAVQYTLALDPPTLSKHQINMVKRFIKLRDDLKDEETALHSKLDPFAQKILKGKNLKLLEILLAEMNWPDTTLVAEVSDGFCITGHSPFSGVFLQEPKVANITEEMLQQSSSVNNQALLQRTGSSGDESVDKKIWLAALEESSNDWLTGPFYEESQLLGHLQGKFPHISRRFPLAQGEKIRAIDDLCESNVNAAFASCEKIWLMDTDYIANGISQLERVINRDLATLTDSEEAVYFPLS